MVSFKVTIDEAVLIEAIAVRAFKGFLKTGNYIGINLLDVEMDVTACHVNGCKLDLNGLLKADDFNFAHDISGIMSHIDRTTGKLEDHFLPRYARGQHADLLLWMSEKS